MKTRAIFYLVLLMSAALPAAASTTMHNFDGNVYADEDHLTGVNVTAWVNNEPRGSCISQNHSVGYESYYNIDVQGDVSELGLNVTFTIGGILADESHEFEMFGNEDNFDLHTEKIEFNMSLVEGWNLISLPVNPIT